MSVRYSADFGRPNLSLNGVSAVGAGDEFGVVAKMGLVGRVTWEKIIGGTGSFSALQVDLEASDDGTNWFQADTDSTTSSSNASVAHEHTFYRLNIISRTIASGAPTVTGNIYIR